MTYKIRHPMGLRHPVEEGCKEAREKERQTEREAHRERERHTHREKYREREAQR